MGGGVKEFFLKKSNFSHKNRAEVIACASSLIIVLIYLFVRPYHIRNLEVLKEAIARDDLGALKANYNVFSFLGFVKQTRMGYLGPFAMAITLLFIAAVVLSVIFIIKAVRLNEDNKVSFYEMAQYELVLWFVLTVVIFWFQWYANKRYQLHSVFYTSSILFVVILLTIVSFIGIKIVEKRERKRTMQIGFCKELRRNWILFLMLVPAFVFFVINSYIPMAGIYFAFEKFNFTDGLWFSPFVGFDNFKFMLKSNLFLLTKNTLLYNLVFIVLGNIVKIALAILLSMIGSKIVRKTSQTLIFMPYFVSIVLLNVIVYNLLNYEVGLVNHVVTTFGGAPIDFYNRPVYWPFLITFFYLWKSVGYGTVVYLAAILGINKEFYEAAEVDGANIFQKIRYITLPCIKPMFFILLLYAIGGIMKGQFDLFYQMVGTNGVLFNATDIFDTYVYRLTISNPLDNGLGTAAGLYQSLFGFVVILITNYLVKRKSDEYALF